MRHEYLDTLLKIKKVEESLGASTHKIPDINLKIRRKLLKEDGSDFDFSPAYIAKTRLKIKKLRGIRIGGMPGLEYVEKNRQNLTGMQEIGIDSMIENYSNIEKSKNKLKNEMQKLEMSVKDCQYCKQTPKRECFDAKDGHMTSCNACTDIDCSEYNYNKFVLDRDKLKEHPSIKSLISVLRRYDPDFTIQSID